MWPEFQTNFASMLKSPSDTLARGVIGSERRMDVYRNNVAVSLNEALSQTFPVIKALVGDEFFNGMAQVFIQGSKPSSPVLSEYGETFADFIQTFSPAKGIPYLSDMAVLEFAWLRAYHAEDVTPLTIDQLVGRPEEELDDLCFEMHPACTLLTSSWPVGSIWQAHQGTATPDLSGVHMVPEHMLVVRPHLDVDVILLSDIAFAFARFLSEGATLGQACAQLENFKEFDPSQDVQTLFSSGAFSGIHDNIEV